MVGGKVIEVRPEGERTRLWVLDARRGRSDEARVYVATEAEMPACGDDVWWQSPWILWTPADRRFADRKLRKVSDAVAPGDA